MLICISSIIAKQLQVMLPNLMCVTQLNVSRYLAMFLDCAFIKKYYFEIFSSLCINAINLDDKTIFIIQ